MQMVTKHMGMGMDQVDVHPAKDGHSHVTWALCLANPRGKRTINMFTGRSPGGGMMVDL